MSEIIHVINLDRRKDRMESFTRQSEEQGFLFKRWEGIIDLAATFRGISDAHKAIVRYAKATNKSHITIAEDDCVFVAQGAWDYYLKNMPASFDLYLGGVYEGKIIDNRLVKGGSPKEMLSGLTLYTVSNRFYNTFLNVNPLSHLDKSLGAMADDYEFYVCPEFICKQLNGYSDQKKRVAYYDRYLKGRKIFGS